MTFDDYSELRAQTDFSMGANERLGAPFVYPALGLAGEAGEVVDKIKKVMRDYGGVLTSDMVEALEKECGDVLWYLDAICTAIGSSLDRAAEGNIAKLRLRAQRGTLSGSGDDR